MKASTKTINRRKPVGHAPTPAEIKAMADRAEARKTAASKSSVPANGNKAKHKANKAKPKAARKASAARPKARAKKAAKVPAKRKNAQARPAAKAAAGSGETRLEKLEAMMRAAPISLGDVTKAFDWQPHSARAVIANLNHALQARKPAERVERLKVEDQKVYRIVAA